ncbi:hypothetical protein EVAR_186_1 [Eumeta japonica]|uniref:Uncharacterized protein n=1 Tax=Eumeta variegata TaxID=151549 RepID=A0A4C1S8S2_EUMVA|nr:hypothetical protein EVAR_186_1 [Eumeta japonica]
MDGKHFKIRAPNNSGTVISIVLCESNDANGGCLPSPPQGKLSPECCLGAGGVPKDAEASPKHSQGCRYSSVKHTEAQPHATRLASGTTLAALRALGGGRGVTYELQRGHQGVGMVLLMIGIFLLVRRLMKSPDTTPILQNDGSTSGEASD